MKEASTKLSFDCSIHGNIDLYTKAIEEFVGENATRKATRKL
jgi:hypothetical protein